MNIPANRVAAVVTTLAALAALIAALCQVFPGTWTNVALAVAALITKLITVLKFMDGSQKFDSLKARTDQVRLSVGSGS